MRPPTIETRCSVLEQDVSDLKQVVYALYPTTLTPADKRVIEACVECSARFYGLAPEVIRQRSRPEVQALPRRIAMFLARELLSNRENPVSAEMIAKAFDRKTHGTILYACGRVAIEMKASPQLAHAVNVIRANVKAALK